MKALILAEDGFEDLELFYPYYRMKEEGYEVVIASSKEKIVGKHGYEIEANAGYEAIDANQFDCLIIPGGKSPERVRLNENAIKITKHFFEKNKPVATICHGAQVLISAGIVRNRNIACWYGIKDDVIAAGGNFIDGVAVDGNIVSARFPQDLPEWMKEFIKLLRGRE